MNVVNHLKHTYKVAGPFRNGNGWPEMPFSISLALTGFAVQLYASYNLIKSENGVRLRMPFLNYRLPDSTTVA